MQKKPFKKVTKLNNSFTQEKTLTAHRERKRKRVIRRRTALISAAGILFLGMSSMHIAGSKQKVQELEAQSAEAREELETVQTYQDDLDYYIGMLEDEEYVAKLARGEYYLTKENEIVFNLPEDAKKDRDAIVGEDENQAEEADAEADAEEN